MEDWQQAMIFVIPLPALIENVRYQWLAAGVMGSVVSSGITQVGGFYLFRIDTTAPTDAEELIVFDNSDPSNYALAHFANIDGVGGASTDPWATPVPGSYEAGTAGAIVGGLPNAFSLINPARVTVVSPLSLTGNNIAARAGDSWSLGLQGLGDISDRTKLWFSINRQGKPDSAAAVFIEETAGLIYANGSTVSDASKGSIVVTDETAGNVTVGVAAEITLVAYTAATQSSGPVSLQWAIKVRTSADVVRTLAIGQFTLSRADIQSNA